MTIVIASVLFGKKTRDNLDLKALFSYADCGKQTGGEHSTKCSNGTLTVTYPTSLTYTGEVTAIPEKIKDTLTSRMVSKGLMMSIVDTSRVPP